MIKIQNLHKKFNDLEVLKGVDLEINRGEVIACLLYTSPSPRDS